jgi:hypothetical protein
MDVSGLVTRTVRFGDVSGVQSIFVDVSGSSFSNAQKELMALIADATSGIRPKTKEDCMALYHKLSVMLGKWVVSELPPAEQKVALAALWIGEELASGSCLPWLFKK